MMIVILTSMIIISLSRLQPAQFMNSHQRHHHPHDHDHIDYYLSVHDHHDHHLFVSGHDHDHHLCVQVQRAAVHDRSREKSARHALPGCWQGGGRSTMMIMRMVVRIMMMVVVIMRMVVMIMRMVVMIIQGGFFTGPP